MLESHLAEARRVMELPTRVNGLHWHPFGVFSIPLAKREIDGESWSRRLHIWHPAGTPVGEASAYGVHTHTGPARSHLLVGSLQHHLYQFEDGDGPWLRTPLGAEPTTASLAAHVQGTTPVNCTHQFSAHQAHSVSKGSDFAISLFEQAKEEPGAPFTTWRRTDIPEEPLVRATPIRLDQVALQALTALDGLLASP